MFDSEHRYLVAFVAMTVLLPGFSVPSWAGGTVRQVIATASEAVDARAGPGIAYSPLFTLSAGSTLAVLDCLMDGQRANWCEIQSGGRLAWVPAELMVVGNEPLDAGSTAATASDIRSIVLDARVVADDSLRLRDGPGLIFDIQAEMPSGSIVQVLGCINRLWCQVTFGGVTGWAAAGYLRSILYDRLLSGFNGRVHYKSDVVSVITGEPEPITDTIRLVNATRSVPRWRIDDAWVISPSYEFETTVSVTLLLFNDSSWSLSTAIEQVRLAEDIFSRCGVSFDPITIVEVSSALPVVFSQRADADFFVDQFVAIRPLVFLLEHEVDNAQAYSYHFEPRLDDRIGRQGTSFVGYAEITNALPPPYSVVAHELAHILTDESIHNQIRGNLLGEWGLEGTDVTPQQCREMHDVIALRHLMLR